AMLWNGALRFRAMTGGRWDVQEGYSYSPIGNLMSKTGVGSYTYGPQAADCPEGALNKPHAVVTAGGNAYCYDQNGNMRRRKLGATTYTLSYDAENRLVGVSGGASASFVYDGDGKRVKATVGSTTTVYIGNYYEQTGAGVTRYYYAGSQRIALRRSGYASDNGLFYVLADHLGSTAVTADASGTKTGELRYYPYGSTRSTWGTTPTTYRFTGQREESTIGLYFYNARWYDPVLGRFVQPDPLVPEPGNPQALNRYAYVLNNPIRYTDPSGHCPWCIPVALGVLKAVDYGWTAYDTWQATRTLANPKASDEDKLVASLTVALAGLEVLEPDDFLPASLPLDDLARRAVTGGAKEAFQQGGLRGGVQFLRRALGEAAPGVIRHLYDQGMFRGIRSAGEWQDILQGVRKEAGLEVHHLIEQRFAERLGLKKSEVPAVVLERTFHWEITGKLFSGELGLPTKGSYSVQQIWDAYKRVYGGELHHQDWLDAIWPYFERLGVQR
ncbi:MAG: RHS repeat-associated core domain-containing protein, partial [candidate division KSB1 bacterium]|nr:RHS repeat-associated core domain-containing protein [candidate division KSB1 bacterium]